MDQPVRVLVVDDDAPTRRLLLAALQSTGLYEVVTARSANEALAFYHSSSGFNLVITDLVMQNTSGLDLIKRLRGTGSPIPILILSSIQTDQTVAQALEAGADDYLPKPVDLRELRAAVAYLLERHGVANGTGEDQPAISIGGGEEAIQITAAQPAIRNMEEGTFVELTALTDPTQAERFQRFAERVLAFCLTEKEKSELHLALEEIVRNAIEWGNRNDPTKKLRLSYCLLSDRITFRVEDEGKGFDPLAIKDPSLNPQKHITERRASGKRMGGWGLFLARKMVDDVSFNRKGNVVFLTKYLRRPENEDPQNGGEPRRRRSTRLLRKTTRLLRREDPRFKEA